MTAPAHISYPFLIVWIVSKSIGFILTPIHIIVLLFCSIIPDFDYVYIWFKDRVKLAIPHHLFFTHTPIYYVPLLIIAYFIDPMVALFAGLGFGSHFFMDMFFNGNGIWWLRPFINKEFYVDNPVRGKHGLEWLHAYKKLSIYKVDLVINGIAVCVLLFEILTRTGVITNL